MGQQQNFKWNTMTMGTCYYPEHWDKKMWADDLRRMQETGISTIRIAEFAWNKFEPEEGVFTFDFFDEFLRECAQADMKVIMGTPTATPPAWLTSKYPEVLNCRIDGTVMQHGGRRHYNYNASVYRELCGRIVTELARHYGTHPSIVGWQIDNELNCEVGEFYSEADTVAFREFLQKKYGTLEALNQAWGTVFWNQTYTDWNQVFVPRHTPTNNVNPHLKLDYYRFVSDSVLSFCKLQADILKKYIKNKEIFITTNGMFGNMNNHKMAAESLDVYTYDSYPSFAFGLDRDPLHSKDLNDRQWSRNLNEVRSICPHFGIMEQQSGANGWNNRMEGPAPRPGQLKLWALQSVAHGADYISFFRWRTCTKGTEIYWHGILDYDSRDNRKLAEVKDFYHTFQKMEPICGADYETAFAVIKDYDNEWDCQVDEWHRRVAYQSEQAIFEASERYHTPYDLVYLQEDTELSDLSQYPVLLYPHPVLMNEERAELLKAYVENGGILLVGCRSGQKDMTGQCVQMPQPGLLAELTGTDVREWTFTSPAEPAVHADFQGKTIEMPIFNDIVTIGEDVEVLASYTNSFYAGTPALTQHNYGKGKVLHFLSAMDADDVAQILTYLDVLEPYKNLVKVPEDVELCVRSKKDRRFLILLNYQSSSRIVEFKQPMRDLESGETLKESVSMNPYQVLVLETIDQ